MRETSPRKWTKTRTATAGVYSIAQIGDYQERIHQDSRGHLFVLNAEHAAGGQIINLYSNITLDAEVIRYDMVACDAPA